MPPHPIVAEWDADIVGGNPLGWDGYSPPSPDSVVTGRTETYAFIEGDFEVMGGSMGAVHGERVVRAYRRAADERLPMVVLTSSGGARLQEGMVALIQLARTASAARAHADAGLLSVAVFRHPTTGGVFASYGSLADIRTASPGATIGFAGPRVVELTTDEIVPLESHTADSAYNAALVDALVDPEDEAEWIECVLGIRDLPPFPPRAGVHTSTETTAVSSAWEEVQRARALDRPTGTDVAWKVCDSWVELRGTDPVVRAALATVDGMRVVMIAHDRRAGTGRPTPAGFRLARRAIALADRLELPLLTFIDTPGAEPGPAAEADGAASEIAATFAAMGALRSASVAICVGEGGSGGALAFGHADRLLMLEHSIFSVIGPEGAAAILERDVNKAPEVAERLRLTAADMVDLGIADGVVSDARAAILEALAAATPGDRHRRIDTVTARWVES